MGLLSVVMIYCNNIQQHWSMQWLDTEQNQINCLNQWPPSSLMHICHWTVISETIKGGYYSWIRDGMETRSTLLWSAPNRRLNTQPPCWLLNALRRRQVTVMASQLPANRMFVQQSVQIANKEISKVRVIVPLWGESTVISGSPHKRRVTWKMLLFDDVIMDWRIPWRHMYHITQYTHYITVINQTMLKERSECRHPAGFFVIAGFDSLEQ